MKVKDLNTMHKAAYYISTKFSNQQIIDARAQPRYLGQVDEPRAGLRKGHIPGAKNVFFQDVLNLDTQTLKSDKELAKLFLEKDVDINVTTTTYCGSGLSACVVNLALEVLGNEKTILYDGSWTEYVQ